MPRIRTFKPEFFRSPDTAKASPRARLLYMALWSWADDEGVGETNIYGLLGFAFPDSDELSAAEIQSLLKEIRGSFGVLFYQHHGRYFYAVPSWNEHQKTERRANARHPKPDDPESVPDLRFEAAEDLRGNSAATQGSSALVTGEPGNIGTGEITVGTTEVSHQSAEQVAPAEKCPRHIDMQNPPDCGACAAASRAAKAWRNRQDRERREAEAAEKARRSAIFEAVRDCPLCDDHGRIETEGGLAYCEAGHPKLKDAG